MKDVLITGGTGTISAGLVREYVSNGYTVTALNRGTKPWREVRGVEYIHLDLSDYDSVKAFLTNKKYNIVIECLVFNVQELKRSLDYFAQKCNKYVFVSTTAIYKRPPNVLISEDAWEEMQDWDYARNKIECERYLVSYCELQRIDYTIIRPPVVYGNYRIPYPVISRKCWYEIYQRMLEGKPLVNNNIKKVRYCILHSSDFSRAVRMLLERIESTRECFHIADEQALYDWDDIIEVVADILECEAKVIHVDCAVFRETFPFLYEELLWNKNDDLLLSGKKVFDLTGFTARKDIREGIKENIESLKHEFFEYENIRDYEYESSCDRTIGVGIEKNLVKDCDISLAITYRGLIHGC